MRLCNRLWLLQMLSHSVLWQAKNSWAVPGALMLRLLASIAVTVSLLDGRGRGGGGGGEMALCMYALPCNTKMLRRFEALTKRGAKEHLPHIVLTKISNHTR